MVKSSNTPSLLGLSNFQSARLCCQEHSHLLRQSPSPNGRSSDWRRECQPDRREEEWCSTLSLKTGFQDMELEVSKRSKTKPTGLWKRSPNTSKLVLIPLPTKRMKRKSFRNNKISESSRTRFLLTVSTLVKIKTRAKY